MSTITSDSDPILVNAATVISFLMSAVRTGESLSNLEEHECRTVVWHLRNDQLRLNSILRTPREGNLEVGLSDDERNVIVNLPQDMTGHLYFTRDQALNLASLLTEKAMETK